MLGLLGIEDSYVVLAYILCIASAALCILYGIVSWTRGEEPLEQEDVRWSEEEKRVEEEL